MEYNIQRNFKVVHETIAFEPYEASEKTMMELQIQLEFESVINASDCGELIRSTDVEKDAVQKLFTYIDENKIELGIRCII